MHHYRKTIKAYRKRRDLSSCPFCLPETLARAVYEGKHIYIVPNLTSYDLWEAQDVEDHLLIIPRRHVQSLSELDEKERLAVMDAAASHEAKGYSIYARGKGFINRSVQHQHTHLIKTSNKQPRILIYMQRPYYYLFKR